MRHQALEFVKQPGTAWLLYLVDPYGVCKVVFTLIAL